MLTMFPAIIFPNKEPRAETLLCLVLSACMTHLIKTHISTHLGGKQSEQVIA